MKFSSLTKNNQDLINELDALDGEGRKKRSRKYNVKGTWKPKQHITDPKRMAPRATSVSVWEFEVDPYTSNQGAYRLIRSQEASGATWYWATHVGENSFKYELITDYEPVKKETLVTSTPIPPVATQHQLKADPVKPEERVIPDSWDDD